MALVLEIQKGEGFYVDDQLVTVEEIYSPSRFKVLVHGKGSNLSTYMEVGNKVQTQLMPEVFVQAGRDQPEASDGYSCKVAIEAPPKIRILRQELYERGVR